MCAKEWVWQCQVCGYTFWFSQQRCLSHLTLETLSCWLSLYLCDLQMVLCNLSAMSLAVMISAIFR